MEGRLRASYRLVSAAVGNHVGIPGTELILNFIVLSPDTYYSDSKTLAQ